MVGNIVYYLNAVQIFVLERTNKMCVFLLGCTYNTILSFFKKKNVYRAACGLKGITGPFSDGTLSYSTFGKLSYYFGKRC